MGEEENKAPAPLAPEIEDRFKELEKRLEEQEKGSRIKLTEDTDSVLLTFQTNGTADTEDPVSHRLGRVPAGYLVLSQDAAGTVYRTETPWTASRVYLKCSTASVRVTLLLF